MTQSTTDPYITDNDVNVTKEWDEFTSRSNVGSSIFEDEIFQTDLEIPYLDDDLNVWIPKDQLDTFRSVLAKY